jgi:RNA polymerase sigma-70 factor (ECF subfamily)
VSRSRLEGLAYRLLGSVADAEDVVQEARLKLLAQTTVPDNEEAWLFRVVTNLALDKLREQKRRRESYPGPWLPEPLPTPAPDQATELAENLSMGLVLMLERLSPAERAVFVLREGFDLAFDDIAPLVDASAAACRQRYRRAKTHLAGELPPEPALVAGADEQRQLLDRFLAAVAERNYESLVALFAEDCVAYTDGGGVVSAAIRPVTDPGRIAQVTLFLADKLAGDGEPEFHWVELNGGPGLLVTVDGALMLSMQVEGLAGRIRRVYIVRNPHKLAHLAAELE